MIKVRLASRKTFHKACRGSNARSCWQAKRRSSPRKTGDVDDDGVAKVALLNVFNLKYVFLN